VIKITKKFLLLIVLLSFSTESNSVIKDSLFATIGDKAITKSDIINEVKTILILSGETFSKDNREILRTAAIQSTIKRTIKEIEIEKYGLTDFDVVELNIQIKELAKNLNMELTTLKSIFEANAIDFDSVVKQIKIELMWNTLIYQMYKDKLSINQSEIDERLKSILDKDEIDEYLVSEIIIEPVISSEVDEKIKEILNRIKIEGFENVAIKSSISETAIRGGDLGWINENVISKQFKSKIINTLVGEISDPIFLTNGILFFKVRDKRKLKKYKNLEEARYELEQSEKQKILKMHSLSHYDNLKRLISINYY